VVAVAVGEKNVLRSRLVDAEASIKKKVELRDDE
jgi:hypothetical protein